MKTLLHRLLWMTCLALGLGASAWAADASLDKPQSKPWMQARRVVPNVYYVQGVSEMGSSANQNFISNAGFVVTPQGVVVIDALGSPELARRLVAEIAKVTRQPIHTVIVTHYHADHIYGLQVFKDLGARIVAHEAARDYLTSDTAQLRLQASRQDLWPWVDEKTRLVPADEWLHGPQELVVGGVHLRVQPVGPSHTAEDLVVYLPKQKVLFAGDLVFRNRIPYVGQADSQHWMDAISSLQKFDTRWMVPGHGPISQDPQADMRLTLDYLHYLRDSMARAARDMEPFDEAYQNTDWRRFEKIPLFKSANRMNAYNTYLLMEHEAK
ncbi:MBL fold metallo-hydrolase [Limnohabitans sp. JirII-31]|uniref:MBL fold metallo-hydrolase n=1 Tax=Limnohabitans sp. JirII-31 TaxID=1977908 RepID=UPI0026ABC377